MILSFPSFAWDRGFFISFESTNKVKIQTDKKIETFILEGVSLNPKPKELSRYKGKVVLYQKMKYGYQIKIDGIEDVSSKVLEWGYADLAKKIDPLLFDEYIKSQELAKTRKAGIWAQKRKKK